MRLLRGAHSESARMNPPNPDARLWLFDFDNTLAALEREVDWLGSRRELEAFLRDASVDEKIFVEIPKGNLPLYAALHTRWLPALSTEANLPINIALARPITDQIQPRVLESPYTNAKDATTPSGLLIRAAGRPSRETAEALLRRSSEIIERHELIGVERAQPTAGAIDLLEALVARGSVVGIVTSNSSRTVARWLQRHGISDLVHAIVGRDSLLALKPSPEMVVRALNLAPTFAPAAQTATTAADAVFVGDSEADFGATRAAGLGFYGIAISHAARDRLVAAGATELFASPAAMRIHLNRAPPEPTRTKSN
jgi:phosphoglycolate phosphatase-like HAD superfamily hydrolase